MSAGAVTGAKGVHASIRLLASRLREIEGEGEGVSEEARERRAVVSLGERDENRKLRERLDQLEERNRRLQSLLDPKFPSDAAKSYRDSALEHSYKLPADAGRSVGRLQRSLQQERMEVRVDVLEQHNRSLEQQLFNLRRALAVGGTETSLSPDTSSDAAKERRLSEEEGLFALVSRVLADPITSRQRRLSPAVTEAVSCLGESLSSMVLELKLNAS